MYRLRRFFKKNQDAMLLRAEPTSPILLKYGFKVGLVLEEVTLPKLGTSVLPLKI